MHKTIVLNLLLLLLFVWPAEAEIVRVELYPDQARVDEVLSMEEKGTEAGFELSAHVRPNTIRIESQEAEIISLSTDIKSSAPAQEMASLKTRLAELEQKKDRIKSSINSLQGEISYLRQAKPASEKGEKLVISLGKAIKDKLQGTYSGLFEQKRLLKEVEKEIQDIENDLKRISGNTDKKLVLNLFLRKAAGPGTKFYLSYVVDKCGWKSEYRVNGEPERQLVDFSWNAAIWQNTGMDWDECELLLSTSKPFWRLTPPKNGTWNINPVRKNKVLAEGRSEAAMDKTSMALATAAEPRALPSKRKQFRTLYDVGTLSLKSGQDRNVAVKQESWPADFDYLVRPYRIAAAFVRAVVDFDAAMRIPRGRAAFFLDSAYVGQGALEIQEKQKEFYFGPDKQVIVDFKNIDNMSGQSGFLSSKSSYSWKWLVGITNNKIKPIDVVIQDIMPKPGDKDIKLEKTFDPKPDKEENRVVTWNLKIEPETEQKVTYGYDIAYPEDMRLELGR